MLIRYKNNHEKIAMGLLSFMPEEKDIKNLQQTIQNYESLDNWHLYLWKDDEDFIGAIGIVILDEMSVVIQHVTVDPSHRNQGIGKEMIKSLSEKYKNTYEVIPEERIASFFHKCFEDKD